MGLVLEKLPTWVLCGAVVLAFCAGILNAIALLGLAHISVSHVTGNVSLLAVSAMQMEWANVKLFLTSVASFWVGCVLSGMIIGGSELTIKNRYAHAMYLEVGLLAISLVLYLNESDFGLMMIAMACGLQNSMVTTYHGTVVRTTHLTGTTSDLGVMVGNWLVGRRLNWHRVLLLSALWWGFLIGGFVAVLLYRQVGYLSMLVPMAIILAAAVSYRQMEGWFDKTKSLINRHFHHKK